MNASIWFMKAKTMSKKEHHIRVLYTCNYIVLLYRHSNGVCLLCGCVCDCVAVHHENTHQFSRFEYRTRIWGSESTNQWASKRKGWSHDHYEARLRSRRCCYVSPIWQPSIWTTAICDYLNAFFCFSKKKTVRFHCVLAAHSVAIAFEIDLIWWRSLTNETITTKSDVLFLPSKATLIINRKKSSQHLQTLRTVSEWVSALNESSFEYKNLGDS